MLEMLRFTSSPLGIPSRLLLSPFVSLLPVLQTCLPCATVSGRHVLHPLQDVPGAGVPLASPLLLSRKQVRRLRKEMSGLQVSEGGRERKGSKC